MPGRDEPDGADADSRADIGGSAGQPPAGLPSPAERAKPLHDVGWQPAASIWESAETDGPALQDEASVAREEAPDSAPRLPSDQLSAPMAAGAHADAPAILAEEAPPDRVLLRFESVPSLPPRVEDAARESYPVSYDVAYPERLSRWKTLLRGFLIVPLWLFLYLINYLQVLLMVVGWTAVFWRKKYPSWAFHGLAGSFDYSARVAAYALLQTDKFPSLDREASFVRLDFVDPPNGRLSRWRVLWWKGVLLVPHLLVLSLLYMALFVVTILAWFGILGTGNYPRGMFAFATGVMRWQYRVMAYFASFNDRYPPYSLSANAGPSSAKATVWSGIGGVVLAGGFGAIVISAAVIGGRTINEDVNYADVQQGSAFSLVSLSTVDGDVLVSLTRAYDPGDDLVQVLQPGAGERVVVFEWTLTNLSSSAITVSRAAAQLTATVESGDRNFGVEFVSVANRGAPASIASGADAIVQAVFVVPASAQPSELQFHNGFAGRGGVTYRFE